MADTISIKKPFDSHVHLRRGSTLRAVTPISAEKFMGAIIMPNTEPPIDTAEMAAEYKKEIRAAIPAGNPFKPLMTFYLTKGLTPAEIEKGFSGEHGVKVFAVKSYPFGATTNSQWGFRSILEAKDVLKKMEELGMPLLLHGEVHLNDHDEEEDPYEGERLFVQNTLPKLLDQFPKLKVSLEHMSTAVACDFMEKNGKAGQLVTTITPTHLMYDRRDAFRGGYRPLLHMKPLIKTQADKEDCRSSLQAPTARRIRSRKSSRHAACSASFARRQRWRCIRRCSMNSARSISLRTSFRSTVPRSSASNPRKRALRS
jgi:dihydroorotase